MALLEIEHLTFTYAGSSKKVLDDISVSIESGEFVILSGPSGCGKTTFLRQLKTVLAPHGDRTGEIRYLGKLMDDMTIREQTKRIGYVMQHPEHQIVTDKVWHELAFGLENLGFDTATMRLRIAEMADYLGISEWYDKPVSELSGGQKQLMNLAAVLVMQPEVLILDEPTSQLDPLSSKEFMHVLARIHDELGTTIIFCAHRLDEVFSYADRVLIMEDGRIFADDNPYQIAWKLRGTSMAQSLPVPAKIALELSTDSNTSYPVTICEGKRYLNRRLEDRPVTYVGMDRSQCEQLHNSVILEAKDIWFRYEREGKDVITDLNIQIHKGEIYALLGANGSGKTTTMSLLGGIIKPYRGKIKIADDHTKGRQYHPVKDGLVSILPQDVWTLFVADTVGEDLEILSKEKSVGKMSEEDRKKRLDQIIEQMKLGALLEEHPYDLSGGEAQRLALAKVLFAQPEILLLDEPTKGMDACYKTQFGQILLDLQRQGVTVVLISHDVEFAARYANRCGLLFRGSVVTERPAKEFFAGNRFYTTAVNRMARHKMPDVVTIDDLLHAVK